MGLPELNAQSENPDINLDLPNIIAPSPTVASLMKFEEIPVSNYTGIPEISIPLFGSKLANGNNFDVKLSYHAANVDLVDRNIVASDVGLGWSLMAGGTISRTVRGMPDEILEIGQKIGIYHTNVAYNINRFYEFSELVENNEITTASPEMINEYMWDVSVKGKYDTEHDLYQYNFLGQTGRFIIKKVDGQLEVFKLDKNNLKIINDYNGTTYTPNSFTIIDDLGNRYVFDVIDNTHSSQMATGTPAVGNNHTVSPGLDYEFRSAFHLSKVYDHNDVLLLDLLYNENPVSEISAKHSQAWNHEKNNSLYDLYQYYTLNYSVTSFDPLPLLSTFTHQNNTSTRKLSEIRIIGKARLDFTYTQGRPDYNMHNPSNAYKLSEIAVKDWDNNPVKKVNLLFTAPGHDKKRLQLAEVREYDNTHTDSNSHYFAYKQAPLIEDEFNHAQNKINFATIDVLEKMTLPTGGAIEFSFESNQYSYIGDEPVEDFDANPENWLFFTTPPVVFSTNGSNTTSFFEIFEEQSVYLAAELDFMSSGMNDWFLTVRNVATNQTVGGLTAMSCPDSTCSHLLVNLPAGEYSVSFTSPQVIPDNTYSVSVKAHYKIRRSGLGGFVPREYLHGGGIRIKEINYFEDAATSYALTPLKTKRFDYSSFDEPSQSSGSLVYPEPVFTYEKSKRECVTHSNLITIAEYDLAYDVTTSDNNLAFVKTKGSDVGYRNVTVFETGNGRTEYTYTSAIEYPETVDLTHTHYPYLPTLNIDYKRGLLLKEKVFDQSNRILKETTHAYSFEEDTLHTGLRFYNLNNYQFINYKGITEYQAYVYDITNCSPCFCYFGMPADFIYYSLLTEAFGWARLDHSEKKEYFYEGSNSSVLQTDTYNTYSPHNRKISQQTVSNSTGGSLTSKFYYAHDAPVIGDPFVPQLVGRNVIAQVIKVESFDNANKVEEKKTVYGNDTSIDNLLLPKYILSKKGSDSDPLTPETRIIFNQYNSRGNILELQQESGVPVSYIWGYNHTEPVAKIENMAYSSIPGHLISAVHAATTEPALLAALDALRSDTALAGAQVTTLTYKPVVGIASVTDPKNYTTTYHYDTFGRLETVKDAEQNILSENEYYYRNQTLNQNYIKSTAYKVPSLSSIGSPDPEEAAVTMQYLDGLGRPVQQIAHKQSDTGKDIIVHTQYDAYGRQTHEFLPYVRSSASLSFDTSGEASTLGFYAANNVSLTGNPHFETTGNPYGEKVLESSPLSRVWQQAAPGDTWHKANGKTVKFDYQTNQADEVVYFKATTAWSSSLGLYTIALVKDNFYAPGELYKTITKDENWTSASGKNHTTEEFKNKQGQVVLKRTYANTLTASEEPHDTYYVYDIYGNLTYVIPPKADVSQTVSQTILDGLCYQYRYDHRNRMVEKKLPGKMWEFMMYDKLDRVVAVGPVRPPFSNLTNYGWAVTKYDKFNRPVLTGWMSSASTISSTLRKTLQDARNAETTSFSESRNAATADVTVMGVTYRYSNDAWPTSGYHVLSVTYYDDYHYPDAPTIPAEIEDQEVYYHNTRKPVGLVTGTWTRVLRTSTSYRNETGYTLYDAKSRPIRVFNRNGELGAGGYTQTDTKFDFSGKAEYTVTLHKRINSESGVTVRDFYTYSAQDKLISHTQQLNSHTPQLISYNEYDELGNLLSKRVGGEDLSGAAPLQKADYRYNVRGWLTGINDMADLQNGTDPLDLFAFRISYDTVVNDVNAAVKPLYNGNIAETFWKTAADNTARSYSYTYDPLNRLNEAIFHRNNQRLHSYDEKITGYDKNGNITGLFRNGGVEDEVQPIEIDDLVYTYRDNSNELIKVRDDSTPTSNGGFVDGADNSEEYGYDDFGNMIRDDNKGITAIRYNHLNLPTKITFAVSGEIEYVYNALGQKREKIVTEGSTVTTTKYMDGYQYENNVLKFFPHAEGYVTKEGSSTYRHVFTFTDHLGNIRLKYCDLNQNGSIETNEILEENHYYPFGLKHEGYNGNTSILANKYKYNGKEWQNDLGLNWYYYGYRNYDPAIARWTTMDPLLNDLKFTFDDSNIDEDDEDDIYEALITKLETGEGIFNTDNLNPYGYGYNNPISFDDPDGRCPVCIYVIAALLYSEFANAPTGNRETDSRNYEASKENRTIVSETVIKRGGNLRGTTGTTLGKTPGVTPKKEKSAEKTYQTYTKKNEKTGETYSGRTSGTGTPKENVAKRDANHHKNKEDYGPAKLDKSSKDKDAIRGREQQLIDKNGKAKSEGGTSGNSVRGVSKQNSNAKKYEEATKKEFGELKN